MKWIAVIVLACVAAGLWWAVKEAPAGSHEYWPQWRGPEATGVSPDGDPPVEWAENKNIRWKVEIPGKGHASPIVWDQSVFVATAIPTEKKNPIEGEGQIKPTHVVNFDLLALDRRRGKILWRRTTREQGPHEGTHSVNTWASNSPVTDGEHIYAFFGSFGLYCLDMDGNPVWEKDLGDMSTRLKFGEGSSPVLYGNKIVIIWDHQGDSFIVALDKRTGEELWKVPRDEETSWSSPIVVEHEGRAQVITSATNRVRSYDLETGDLIWDGRGMTLNAIPSPVASDGIVYVTSGFRGNVMQAIRFGAAKGDITGSKAIAWELDRDTPYIPSPLLYGDLLYFVKSNSGLLSCFNAKTGEAYYGPQRLEGLEGVYSSPVGAGDRVYLASQNGTTIVIRRGPQFEVLATNTLEDGFDASPAVAGKEIYLRGRRFLYCVATDRDGL